MTVPFGIAAAVTARAIPLGWLSIRLSGFYFLMITFAFAQMVYVVAFRWKWLTGGSDGLLIPSATFLGLPVLQQPRGALLHGARRLCAELRRHDTASCARRFGRALAGIRENTLRMRALGYNVRRYKLIAFVIAAGFGGVAGVLNSQFNLFIAPESVHWTQSALVLVMVLIGGSGYLPRADHRGDDRHSAAALAELLHRVLGAGAGPALHRPDQRSARGDRRDRDAVMEPAVGARQ